MSASFEAALAAGRASAAEALALFDALGPVATTDLRGGWAGRGFPTGHPLDGVLAAWHWHGKRFESDDAVDPLVMRTRAGALLPIDPTWARPLLPLWMHWRWLASPAAARLAWPLLPLLATGRPRARLRMLEHRGCRTAAMLYDTLPVRDVFRRVDADTVLGAMELRGQPQPLFFVLRREAQACDPAGGGAGLSGGGAARRRAAGDRADAGT
ncbi:MULTISPECIES: DUF4334 domain-containing protein [Ramlibacter]|uniref:DUF4334 domain-containing protein n=1 Tax=Ramlibacter pinisoli TaxID=2682844 RepID=A0A6N8IUA0_9BURK|nr:DUF4334 domain-containing protein [Ramlibacter sp. CGMCC 1.13660]MVQ30511.1 DUF4334 domain-containing protein [Ramlibacter pinisoli]